LEINPEILKRYNEHTANEAECKAVEDWLNDYSEDRNVLSSNELNSMKHSVWRQIQQKTTGANVVQFTKPRKKNYALPLTAALAIFLFLPALDWILSE